MKGKAVVHSKGKDDWRTPQWLFDLLNKEFEFGLDAAADEENSLCDYFFDEGSDALKQDWGSYGNVFVNPPYSKNPEFIKKCWEQAKLNPSITVVALIPSRTDTRWWHKYIMLASDIGFIKGRLNFSDAECGAPFPSCIVLFSQTAPILGGPETFTIEKPEKKRKK